MAEKVMELRKGGSVDVALALQSGTGVEFDLETASSNLKWTKLGSVVYPFLLPVSAKTASYTCTQADCGTTFTNRGASGTVTFTLPAAPSTGTWYRFYVIADFAVVVATTTADTLIVFNDATADSVALQTSAEMMGGGFEVMYDGTGWLTWNSMWETQTVTIVTA